MGETPQVTRVTVVLPCFNEGSGLRWMAAALESTLEAHPQLALTTLFVDDGSTDDTWDVIEELSARGTGRVRGLRLRGHQGKAAAQAAGMRAAITTSDFVAVMDSDGQHDASLLPEMIERCRESGQPVLAARVDYRRGIMSRLGTAGLGLLAKTLGVNFDPALGEFMVLPSAAVSSLAASSRLGLLPLVPVVQALGGDYEEYVVSVQPRDDGERSNRWGLADLWHKAIMHLLVDPWSLLPRITMLIAGLVVFLGGYGLVVGIWSMAQGTFLGIGSVLVALVLVFAALAALTCATLGVAVVSYQSSASLAARSAVQEEVGS